MLDQLVEREGHLPSVRAPEPLAVPVDVERQLEAPVTPRVAELVGRDGDGENADDGFALKNPKPVESSRAT